MGGFFRRHKRVVPFLLLAPGILWLIVFYAVPGFQMFLTSLWSGTLETGYEFALSNVSNYTEALTKYWPQFSRSLLYGAAATLLTFAISYPLAYTIAFRGGKRKSLLLFLVIAPFFTSFLIRTISWKILLGDEGPIFGFLKHGLGILPGTFSILGTPVAQLFGITYNFLPFMILPLYIALEKLDPALMDAASDLYAGRWQVFRRVTFPLALPGVFAGSLLTFIPAMGDYINAELLGNPQTRMIGNVIQNRLLVQNDYPVGSALSFILMASILVAVALYARALGTEQLTG